MILTSVLWVSPSSAQKRRAKQLRLQTGAMQATGSQKGGKLTWKAFNHVFSILTWGPSEQTEMEVDRAFASTEQQLIS
jgi:hypothetical protein